MKEIIRVTKLNARDVGVVYICNPNIPTGRIVPKDEIKLLLDSIPGDIPVFIDEAYHHFVDDPNYEPSVKYVIEGRKVIIARTSPRSPAGRNAPRLCGCAERNHRSAQTFVMAYKHERHRQVRRRGLAERHGQRSPHQTAQQADTRQGHERTDRRWAMRSFRRNPISSW